MREFWGAKCQLGRGHTSAEATGSSSIASGQATTYYPVCFLEELVSGVEAEGFCGRGLAALQEGVKRRGQIGHVGAV